MNYKDRWTEVALKLEDLKLGLINESAQKEAFVERPKKIVSVLQNFKHSSNHGILVYSISKVIGGDEKISLFSGLTADFLGDAIRTYDNIVEVRESERKSHSPLFGLDSYELVCIYTTLLMLANRCMNEISKDKTGERFDRLSEAILNFPYLSIPDKTREKLKTLPQTKTADIIVDRISDYGKILGLIAAIPVAHSMKQINLSANVGKKFCAGMHLTDEVHDFLDGTDVSAKKFGNYVFSQLTSFSSPQDRALLKEYMTSASVTEKNVRTIIMMAINNGALDSVMNTVQGYMNMSKKNFLQMTSFKDLKSKEFVVETFDYVADVIGRTMKAYHSDVSYIDRLKHLPRRNVLQSRMFCSYFVE
jgi:hypothetical protein